MINLFDRYVINVKYQSDVDEVICKFDANNVITYIPEVHRDNTNLRPSEKDPQIYVCKSGFRYKFSKDIDFCYCDVFIEKPIEEFYE